MTANVSQRGKTALKRSIAWYLRQWSRILNVLTDEELERLIPLLSERSFRSRFQLFSTGEPPERVYLILKGRVKVYQVAENGKEVILDVVSRGGIVGDWAIVENGERTACAQAIDDTTGVVLAAASDLEAGVQGDLEGKNKKDRARVVGKAIAAKLLAKSVAAVVFDRNGYLYHGRVAQVADGAREGGLAF